MPDTIELQLSAARLALGHSTAADLKAAASAAIDAGVVTPDIARLATLRDDTLSEAEPLFRKALGELRIGIPTPEAATWLLLKSLIGQIAEGAIEPEEGLKAVMTVYNAANLHGRSQQYAGDSHDIHPLVGSYWEIDDVRAHSTEVDFDSKYGAVLEDLHSDVIEHARAWVSRHAA